MKVTELDSILPELQQIELDAAEWASEAGTILFKDEYKNTWREIGF